MIRIRLFIALIVVLALVKHFEASAKPNPVDPNPPTPSGNIRVLIVEETSARSTLPPSQLIALTSGDVRDYLNSHCDKDGSTSAWRIFDKDADVANESKEWQDEFAVLKKESPPAIAIKNGRRWSKPQPLPKDTDALLTLLKKYGGK